MQVVRAEVLKLLQAGIIYPISYSTWVSPTKVVPKKSGVTMVHNEKGEEMPTRLTTGWRVCDELKSHLCLGHFSVLFSVKNE